MKFYNLAYILPPFKKGEKMSKKIIYKELKKQFDDMVYNIVKTRTLNYSDEINFLVRQISPQIDKINTLLQHKEIRN